LANGRRWPRAPVPRTFHVADIGVVNGSFPTRWVNAYCRPSTAIRPRSQADIRTSASPRYRTFARGSCQSRLRPLRPFRTVSSRRLPSVRFSDARSYAKIESCRTTPCALAFQVKTGGSMPWARSAKDIGCALTLPFGGLVRMNVKLLRRSAERALTAHSRQCTFALNAAEGVRGIRCTPR
jgi:hypothetical protein